MENRQHSCHCIYYLLWNGLHTVSHIQLQPHGQLLEGVLTYILQALSLYGYTSAESALRCLELNQRPLLGPSPDGSRKAPQY